MSTDPRIAAISPTDLLPERRRDEAHRIESPLRTLASTSFDGTHGIAVVRDARGVAYGVPWVDDAGGIRRASAGEGTAEALLAALADPSASGIDAQVFHAVRARGERAIDVDQTNDLVVVGDVAVVKWALHPESLPAPGPSRLAALARAGFTGTPRTWALVHVSVEGERMLVATVSDYIPGAQDGWDWAVDEVRAHARGGTSGIDDAVAALGGLVARLHLALAAEGVVVADDGDAARWHARALADVAGAGLDAQTAGEVEALLEPLRRCAGTPTIAVHGDLHIGQVLRATDPVRYLVIDFDGNPTQDAAERLEAQPAARDVAGMLASLDHVGRVVLHRTEGLEDSARARVRAWIEDAQVAFLDAYVRTLGEAGQEHLLDRTLLTAMQAQQECREYAYAARYLPHWRYVPDAALPALLARATTVEP